MQISFYTLSDHKAQDILGFICGLTQKALNNSEQTIVVLSDDETLMDALDEALWSHEKTSFIPHQRLAMVVALADISTATSIDTPTLSLIDDSADTLPAPVLLSPYLPAAFKGIVLNTTTRPITDFITTDNRAAPTRILELIAPDDSSMQAGRDKYKHYKNLGYELTHFKV